MIATQLQARLCKKELGPPHGRVFRRGPYLVNRVVVKVHTMVVDYRAYTALAVTLGKEVAMAELQTSTKDVMHDCVKGASGSLCIGLFVHALATSLITISAIHRTNGPHHLKLQNTKSIVTT